jgi:hypothetical protein
MTAKELMKRNHKAENLRVLQTEDGSYFVESEKGKILYQVVYAGRPLDYWLIYEISFWVYPDFPNNLVHGKALVKTIESLKTG